VSNKIAIIDTYYPAFLESIEDKTLNGQSYGQLKQNLMKYRFGTSDAYSFGLSRLGWEAEEIVPNSFTIQKAWCNENTTQIWGFLDQFPPSYVSRISLVSRFWQHLPTLHRVLNKQIWQINPDVIYFQDLNFATESFLKTARNKGALVVGQIASPLPPDSRLKMYDLILSSLPNQVEYVRRIGVKAEFLPIGFDSRIIEGLHRYPQRDIPVSFVGGISKHHPSTIPLLEAVFRSNVELQIFGYGGENLSKNKKLFNLHGGEKWGMQMYEVLLRSRVTLNRHISISENFANNMRLFEATGTGALLITDLKSNLGEYFKIGTEVLAYETFDEAADLVKWSLYNAEKASEIATAGQRRTLLDHTYAQVTQKLDAILRSYL
jgi:spore maturation protein CgeB